MEGEFIMFDDSNAIDFAFGYDAKGRQADFGHSEKFKIMDSGGGIAGGSDSRFGFKDWNWTGGGYLGNDSEGGVNDHGLIGHKNGTIMMGYTNTIGSANSVSSMSNSGAFMGSSFSSHNDVTNFRLAMTDIEYSVDKDGQGLTIGDVKFENMGINEIETAMMDYDMRDKIAKSGITTQELAMSLRDVDARGIYSAQEFRNVVLNIVHDRLGVQDEEMGKKESLMLLASSLSSTKEIKEDLKDASTTTVLSLDYGHDKVDIKAAEEESDIIIETKVNRNFLASNGNNTVAPSLSSEKVIVDKNLSSGYKFKSSDNSLYNKYFNVNNYKEDKSTQNKHSTNIQSDNRYILKMDYGESKAKVSPYDSTSKSSIDSTFQKTTKDNKAKVAKESVNHQVVSVSSDGSGSRFAYKDWNWAGDGFVGPDGTGGVNDHGEIGYRNGEMQFGYFNTNNMAGSLSGKGIFMGNSFNSHDDVNTFKLNNTNIKYSVDRDGMGMSIGDVKFDNLSTNEVERAFLDHELISNLAKQGLSTQDVAYALKNVRDVDFSTVTNSQMLKEVIMSVVETNNPTQSNTSNDSSTKEKQIAMTNLSYTLEDGKKFVLSDTEFSGLHSSEIDDILLDEDFKLSLAKSNITNEELNMKLRTIDTQSITNADDFKKVITAMVADKVSSSQDPDESSHDISNKSSKINNITEDKIEEKYLAKLDKDLSKTSDNDDETSIKDSGVSVEDIDKDSSKTNNISAIGKVGINNGEKYKYKQSDTSFYKSYNRMSEKFSKSSSKNIPIDISSNEASISSVDKLTFDYGQKSDHDSSTSVDYISGTFKKLKEQFLPTEHKEIKLEEVVSKVEARDSDPTMSVEPADKKIEVQESIKDDSINTDIKEAQKEASPDESTDMGEVEPSVYGGVKKD